MIEKKYIEFNLIEEKPKTSVYSVNNLSSGIILGTIKWYPAWRQYCFFPKGNTVYSMGCINDIESFIQNLMENRKK